MGSEYPAVRGAGTNGRMLCMAEPCCATRKYRVMSCSRPDTLHKEHEHIWVNTSEDRVAVERNEVGCPSFKHSMYQVRVHVYFLLADSPFSACSHILYFGQAYIRRMKRALALKIPIHTAYCGSGGIIHWSSSLLSTRCSHPPDSSKIAYSR